MTTILKSGKMEAMALCAEQRTALPTAVFVILTIAALAWIAMVIGIPNSEQNCLFFCGGETNFYYDFFINKAVSKMPHQYVETAYSSMVELSKVSRHDQCYPPLANYWVGLFPESPVGAVSCTLIGVVVFILGLSAFFKRFIPGKGLISTVVVCCSAPFLFAVTVANLILYAVGFSLVFLAWYDSTSQLRKSVAAMALAISVVLKISPVLLGVLYLGRNWRFYIRHAILSAVIALILFIVPFTFCGGLEAFKAWLENASMNASTYATRNHFGLYGLVVVLVQSFSISQLPLIGLQILRVVSSSIGLFVLIKGCRLNSGSLERGAAVALGMLFLPPTMMYYTALFIIPFAISGMFHYNERIRKASAAYCLSQCTLLQIPLFLGRPGSLNESFAAAASIDLAIGLSLLTFCKKDQLPDSVIKDT